MLFRSVSLNTRMQKALYLSHLFDLGAAFSDERATLAGWDHQPQGDGGLAGGRTVAHGVDYILRTHDKKGKVNTSEC